jgi:6-pyruvoyltetrahydropterin/6-carboxytetrahydropterin synthase
MYTLAVNRAFTARHYLIGGEWGAENQPHAHEYRLEVSFEGPRLDRHGYLLDITAVESRLDQVLANLSGVVLNDLPALAGLNPSIEHLARLICADFRALARSAGLAALSVRVWESDSAWVRYRERLACASEC